MRLTQFEYLAALRQYGSFSKASEKLYVSQPAISKSVRELEAELNSQILIRTGHGVRFTPFGETLMDSCGIILNEVNHIRNLAKNYCSVQNRLCIAGPAHFAAPALVPLVMEINDKNSSTVCDMRIGSGPILISQIQANLLDFALIYSNSISEHDYESACRKGFVFKPLFTEPMLISCRIGHPLSGRPISRRDVCGYPFISMYDLPDSRVGDLMKENNQPEKIVNVLARISERQIACSSDTLISAAPTALQSDNSYLSNRLDFLDVTDLDRALHLCLVYHSSASEELAQYISDIVVEKIKNLLSMPNCFGDKPLRITYQ